MINLTVEFLKALENEMNSITFDGQTARIQPVQKNNGIVLHGVCVTCDGHACAPTIYVEDYVTDNTNLNAVHEIARDLYGTAMAHMTDASRFDNIGSLIMDYERVKDNLRLRLVNYDANKEMLNNVVHERFLDLAKILVIVLDTDVEENTPTIKVSDSLLECWNVDYTTVMRKASTNTLHPYSTDVVNMCEMLGLPDMGFPMYVVTNKDRCFGAIQVLNLAKRIKLEKEAKLVILPSSVHEVIIVPNNDDTLAFANMIKEVNASEVAPEEVLSDHPYYLNVEIGEITM